MTNILLLPKFSPDTAFALVTNSEWNDAIFFTAIGSPSVPITMVGAITNGSVTVTVESTVGLVVGQQISGGGGQTGLPTGCWISGIPSEQTFTLGNLVSNTATATNAECEFTFQPLPLDLTGINFVAQMRKTAGAATVYLTATTVDGTLNNGGTSGVLAFAIPQSTLANIFPDTYVLDIVAVADGHFINMFPEGPATVTVGQGITNPSAWST